MGAGCARGAPWRRLGTPESSTGRGLTCATDQDREVDRRRAGGNIRGARDAGAGERGAVLRGPSHLAGRRPAAVDRRVLGPFRRQCRRAPSRHRELSTRTTSRCSTVPSSRTARSAIRRRTRTPSSTGRSGCCWSAWTPTSLPRPWSPARARTPWRCAWAMGRPCSAPRTPMPSATNRSLWRTGSSSTRIGPCARRSTSRTPAPTRSRCCWPALTGPSSFPVRARSRRATARSRWRPATSTSTASSIW